MAAVEKVPAGVTADPLFVETVMGVTLSDLRGSAGPSSSENESCTDLAIAVMEHRQPNREAKFELAVELRLLRLDSATTDKLLKALHRVGVRISRASEPAFADTVSFVALCMALGNYASRPDAREGEIAKLETLLERISIDREPSQVTDALKRVLAAPGELAQRAA